MSHEKERDSAAIMGLGIIIAAALIVAVVGLVALIRWAFF